MSGREREGKGGLQSIASHSQEPLHSRSAAAGHRMLLSENEPDTPRGESSKQDSECERIGRKVGIKLYKKEQKIKIKKKKKEKGKKREKKCIPPPPPKNKKPREPGTDLDNRPREANVAVIWPQ